MTKRDMPAAPSSGATGAYAWPKNEPEAANPEEKETVGPLLGPHGIRRLVAAAVCAVILAVRPFTNAPSSWTTAMSDLMPTAAAAIASVALLRSSRSCVGSTRLGVRLLAAGAAMWAAGQAVWTYHDLVVRTAAPTPSLADAG